jgi:hypothetical protein
MKLNYGGSNVLKLSVQLAYDRFFTSYAPAGRDVRTQPIEFGSDAKAKDFINRNKKLPLGANDLPTNIA